MATLRVHVKVLADPTEFTVDEMCTSMRDLYSQHGLTIQEASRERLDLPLLQDVDVGGCTKGESTEEQQELFAYRNGAAAGDIVLYFVRSTVPAYNGCAAHPAGMPSAVVASIASKWTCAHELGHVLGLPHVSDSERLMTGGGTANITNPPPDLTPAEVRKIKQSPYVR